MIEVESNTEDRIKAYEEWKMFCSHGRSSTKPNIWFKGGHWYITVFAYCDRRGYGEWTHFVGSTAERVWRLWSSCSGEYPYETYPALNRAAA